MDGDALCSIGELARRTGLTVKTIRFYSDRGIVSPTDRSPAGYRRYDTDAAARLDLVRTLRELGIDLATIRRVVDRELSLPEVAAAHADALDVQIRVLRLRRAVLTAVAERGSTPEETASMHRLAQLSEDERRRLIGEFLDSVFGGHEITPAFAGAARSLTPELPDNPEAEQVQAWVELAELSQDPDFRAGMRRTAEDWTAEEERGGPAVPRPDIFAVVRDRVGPALKAGTAPTSPRAAPIVAAITSYYADLLGRSDKAGPDESGPGEAELRRRLAARLAGVNDPRRERYLRLLAVVNGWPAPESLAPALDWTVEALSVRGPVGGVSGMNSDRVLEAFRRESEALGGAVAGLSEAEWDLPTRCAPWTVRELFGHVCVVIDWLPGMLDAPAPAPGGAEVSAAAYYSPDDRFSPRTNRARISLAQDRAAGSADGAAFADDFAAVWRRADRLCRAQPDGRTVRTRHGDAMLLSEFLLTRVVEVAVHGLDLADALGREPWLTLAAGDAVLELLLGAEQVAAVDELGWSRPRFLRKATGREPLDESETGQIERLGIRWLALG